MKFSISKEKLIQATQHVVKVVASKTNVQILDNMKLELTKDYLQITGTNLEIGIDYTIPSEIEDVQIITVEEEGSICLKARHFNDIIRKLSSDIIDIEVTNNYVTSIKSGNSEFTLHGLDSEEFPKLPEITQDKVFSISSELLKSMIRQTVFSVSTEETRPVLTGVKMNLENGLLNFVATDSHRLAKREAEVEAEAGLTFQNIIVPGKSLIELNKILEDKDTLVDIVIASNQIFFKVDTFIFYSRIIDGQYPDVSRILQQQTKTILETDKKEFLDSLERASLIARDTKNNEVKLSIKADRVSISSNSPDVGKVNEQINPLKVEGDDLLIAFNTKYVQDVLRIIEDQKIEIHFTGAMSPFIIKPKDIDRYIYLVLPIRIY